MPAALDRFLSDYRRRLGLARAADAVFVAACTAGLAAAALRLIGSEGVDLFLPGESIGVAAAVAFGLTFRRPPTRSAVAAWLDRRHATGDLFATAHATRHDVGPWADAVFAMAAARAAALPPAGRLTRFGTRQWACGLAAVAVVNLVIGLATSRQADKSPANGRARVMADRATPDALHVAAVAKRAGDTADEQTAAAPPFDHNDPNTAAADQARAPHRSNNATANRGDGRADGRQPMRLPERPAAAESPARRPGAPVAAGPSGAGAAGASDGTSVGKTSTPITAGVPTRHAGEGPADSNNATDRTTAADRTLSPADSRDAYRSIVRDFFDR